MTPAELRDALTYLGMKQVDVARMLGVHPRSVRKWTGGHAPIPSMAESFLRFLVLTGIKGETVMAVLRRG